MKKKLIALMLAQALCLGLTPALAAEGDTAFADVAADAWYAPYVDYVARDGVMIGTGDGAFSPEKELTQAECLTLAYRLYDLLRGQQNVVETAPEEWGYITLAVGGKTFEGYGDDESGLLYYGGAYQNYKFRYLEINLSSELEKWGQEHDGERATVTVSGKTYTGHIECWMPSGWVLRFVPDAKVSDEASLALHTAIYRQPGADRWWRDTCYTIEKRGLTELFDPVDFKNNLAPRSFFAKALYVAAGDYLEKINEVEAIPDLARSNGEYVVTADLYREQVYALYEAGILNGVDKYGTFAGDKTLTRAEAAAMAARIVEPSLRVEAPAPITENYRAYTLTPVDLGEREPLDRYNGVAADWLPVIKEDRTDPAIYRADGTIFTDFQDPDGGPYLGDAPGAGGVTRYATLFRWDPQEAGELAFALFDVEAGKIVVPYGGYSALLEVLATEEREEEISQEVLDALGFPYGTGDMPVTAWDGVICLCGEGLYVDYDLHPVAERFDWTGPLNSEGAGFVCKDGQIYRIQFEQ